jgi:hypothetical protein
MTKYLCAFEKMNFITNLILNAVLIISALCLIAIYGHSLIGFVVLPAFTFMGIKSSTSTKMQDFKPLSLM